MAKYLVEVAHTDRECVWSLQRFLEDSPDGLALFQWGCKDGVHVGWAVLDAEHRFGAQTLVPQILRAKTRIVELCVFSPEEIRAFHEGEAQADLAAGA
jgi:hypothetical protein